MPPIPKRPVSRSPHPAAQPEVVDPRWILQTIAALVLLAAVFGYITVCAVFYYAQWQLVLTPSHTVSRTPSDAGLTFSPVRFGPASSGQPQLDGWWVPADLPTDPTVLLLHAGTGSISDALPQARALHDARLNVLLFDYRGFGRSDGKHPSEALMEEDSEAALTYLTGMRHTAPAKILVYGTGVGGSLAARLCRQHKDIAGIILENVDGDFESRVRKDSRARMVPVGMLFHEQFPLAERLHTLATPKLLISYTDSETPPVDFARAADPKMTVEIASTNNTDALHSSLRRFLDTYISQPPPLLRK